MSERDEGPQPKGNIRNHLPELAAEGYTITYCRHARDDQSKRHAAWKTLDTTDLKVVMVMCIDCYMAELGSAAQALFVATVARGRHA